VEVSREGYGRGLTPDAFEALLAVLHPNREEAGKMYEQIRRRLVRLFEWRGCTCPEELADVTFDRVAQRLAGGLTLQRNDPYAYFCGVAHHVFQEVLRSEARKGKALESADWPPANPEEDEPDFRLDHLRRCLDKLGSLQRRLLLDYYRDDRRIQSRKDLCTEMGIELNALRIRVHRLRKKVESCIQERFQY
jgi:DNA-directed RNA polymerase specialized sigma24 family protein